MKIHELLTPENIELNFAPSPGQELTALVSLAFSRARADSMEACRFQEDELHLIHRYMSEGLRRLDDAFLWDKAHTVS